MKTVVFGVTSALLLIGMSTLVFNIHPVKSQNNLLMRVEVSKTMISVGDSINITLTLVNVGTDNVTIIYGPPLFDVSYCTFEGCFQWSDGKYFVQIVLELTLTPGENYSQTLQWNLYQYRDGRYDPPRPGVYYLVGLCPFVNSILKTVIPSYVVVRVVEPKQLVLKTDKDIYLLGEAVNFTLTNISNETIHFGGWPFCEVYAWPSWELVAPEAIVYLAWSLDPGVSVRWTWDPTATGLYVAKDIYGYNCTKFLKIRSTVDRIISDINGDGKVDIKDIWMVAYAFGSYLGHSRWNPFTDTYKDYEINIVDLYEVARDYGKTI